MKKKRKDSYISFLGVEIDNLTKMEAIKKIRDFLHRKEKGYIVTPNASHMVELQNDKKFLESYKNALLIVPDGFSIVLASKLLGKPLKEKCSGADLFPEICKLASELGMRIFILGGRDGSEKIVEEKIREAFPGIVVSSFSPPFGFEKNEEIEKEIINLINDFKTDILFVCVGTPKSEKWIYKNFNHLNINLAFSLGSAPEFFTGVKRRAPKWMQKVGLEWLWRLIQEPGRLWKRYLIGNTIFIWLIIKELIKNKKDA